MGHWCKEIEACGITEHEREREEADKKKKKRIGAVGKLFCVIFLSFTKEVYSIAVIGCSTRRNLLFFTT